MSQQVHARDEGETEAQRSPGEDGSAPEIRSDAARAGRGLRGLISRHSAGLSALASIGGVLCVWQVAAIIVGDSLFLPRVDEVVATGYDMYASGELMPHVTISLQRALIGFTIAAVAGAGIGLAMGTVRGIDRFVQPLISVSYPIPKIGLVPLAILWLGIGEASKIAVIVTAAIYPVMINVYAGVRAIDTRLVWRARTLGASRTEVFRRVAIPATLPALFVGLRLAMGLSWILLFAAEMVAAQRGLGHLIIRAQQLFQSEVVFVSLGGIAILGFIFDRLVEWISRSLCGWHYARGGTRR